jgi:hypothetical protein
VLLRSGGTSDQKRDIDASLSEFFSIKYHFIQARCNEAGQTDYVSLLSNRSVNDLLAINHDTHIYNLVVIAAEDDTHDIFADIVHVTFDSGE